MVGGPSRDEVNGGHDRRRRFGDRHGLSALRRGADGLSPPDGSTCFYGYGGDGWGCRGGDQDVDLDLSWPSAEMYLLCRLTRRPRGR